jgi:hypothetical protein
MTKDWKELLDEEIFNYDGSPPGEIARLDRVMRQRTVASLKEVKTELHQLADSVGTSTDRFVGVGNRLIETIESESRSQARQQRAIIWLTVVIAIATVAYVIATWVSVQAMQEANELKHQEIRQEHKSQSNHAMK